MCAANKLAYVLIPFGMAGRKEFFPGLPMPTNLDSPFEANTPPLPTSLAGQQHARDELELVSLRATVVRLLEEIRLGPAPVLHPQASEPAIERRVAQAQFLAMLAHELRNPLQSIAMANELLAGNEHTSHSVAQVHGVLSRQIGHMSCLLDDLLDASRAANGKIVLQLAPVALLDVINAALETSNPDTTRRRQHIQVDLPPEAIAITGDFTRLTQVFSNLLVNASKFSNAGGNIAIVATCKDGFLDVTVSDNGVGIGAELLPLVFDMFAQGPRTLDRVQGGLGIGLFLVRKIVQLHGGTWHVSSPGAGAGSSFTIGLPLLASAELPPPLPAAAPVTVARNILIIEDNVDANEMMGMLLEMEGHTVTGSFDGADGLRRALDGDFDVVLCDLGLPQLTGFEVVAALKAARGQNGPFVIATTGYSDDAQRDLARAAGFDHYLVKPLDLAALYKVIAGCTA